MVIMVSGGSDSLYRFRQWLKRPLARSTIARVGKGIVTFASTDEVLPLVYRPNLSVRDVCREAAIKVKIHPVSLDFFTLVSVDASGSQYLDPNKRLCEAECHQTYKFRLCIKAFHVVDLMDLDKGAFEYYFHQCREDFLSGKIHEFENDGQKGASRIRAILFEITYIAKQDGVCPKTIIDRLPRKVKKLCQTGVLQPYEHHEIKKYFKGKIELYDKINDVKEVKRQYITCLEKADDFFVYKLAFEEMTHNIGKRCDILVSAEFGIKKRRREDEANRQEYKDISIVQEFSEIEALDLNASHEVTIYRTNFGPERLKACSPQAADSLLSLIEGYYRLMVNQYKSLRIQGNEEKSESFCHGPISRRRAEYILKNSNKQDGLFLIRRGRECFYTYIISLYHGDDIKHFKIKKNRSEKSTTFALESDESPTFSSLSQLIEHYKHSKDGLPVNLTEICKPQTEGLSALLDRASLAPAPPDASLVDPSVLIPLNELKCETLRLSKGEFGELKKGSWRSPSFEGNLLDVVLRAVVKPVGRKNIANFQGSMRTFLELKHHHLLQLYGITETQRAFNFVFEFAERGLDDYIKAESATSDGITKRKVLLYAAQITEGMMFLHSKEIVHGRLNAHNVLLSSEECVKISDYGLLHLVENGQLFYASEQDRGHDYCWYSPTSLQFGKFTAKDDIWSFGMTLWEMLIMKKPYHCSLTNQVLDKDQVLKRYLEQRFPNVDRPNIPTKVGELIRSCWAPILEKRPDFQTILSDLRSDELVPEKEAMEKIDSVLSELEDWEIPTVSNDQLELQMHTDDTEVSNADYSYLAGGQTQVNASGYARNLPGITLIPSASVFNTSIFRKESVSKTFSHPDLIRRIFGTEISHVSEEASSCLLSSKTSAARPSSCPPAIEASSKRSDGCPGRRSVPRESAAAREFDLVHNGDSQLLSCPFLLHPESQSGDFGEEIPMAPGTEELSETEYNTDDFDSDDGQDTGFCAEALAMRALGGIAVKASTSPSNSSQNVGSDEEHKTETLEEMLGHDSPAHTLPRLFGQTLGSSAEENAGDNLDTSHHKASAILDGQGTGSASPYTKIGSPQPVSDLRDHDENPDHFAIPHLESRNGCLTNMEASWSGYFETNVRDSGVIASSNGDGGLGQHDSSAMETTSAITEFLPLANSLCSKTVDESLACFTNVSSTFFDGNATLSEILLDVKEDNPCTLITDLQDDIDSSSSDLSSRDDAETSLCRMFESGRNRSVQENQSDNDKVLDPGFELDFTFEDCEIPPQLNVDNSWTEVDTQGIEPGHYLSEKEQMVFIDSSLEKIRQDLKDEKSSGHTVGDNTSSGPVGFLPGKLQNLPLVFDNGLESIEMVSLPLNNLSKECMMQATEHFHFKDEMSSRDGLDLNFFEDTCSNDGCLLDGACEADNEISRSIPETSPPNPDKVSKNESRKEIPSATDHPDGKKQSSMTVSKASNEKTSNGYKPTTKQEPILSILSPSQSSEGIWPCSDLDPITPNAALGKKPLLDLNEIDEKLQIKFEELQIERTLGQGNFGKVRKATWVHYDSGNFRKKEEVAVKSLKNNSSDRNCSDFIKEIRNMVKLQSMPSGSHYVIKLRGVSQNEDETLLVTELAPLGALDKYLREKKGGLGTRGLLNFCVNISKGMAFLESHKMLHRDLAARNILVMTEELVKISDFGLSRHQEYYRLELKTNEAALLPRKWYAPECLRRQSFTSKSDVWSFAVTMWEIFTSCADPYEDIKGEDLLEYLEKGSRLPKPDKCPDKVFKVMQKCWKGDPQERPTFYLLGKDLQECLKYTPREPQL